MAIYKITFTPSGAYFFGNEKTFEYSGAAKHNDFGNLYYIRGERLPLQSTILGALRFILLPVKGFDKLKEAVNVAAVGGEGFDISKGVKQDFGRIKSISPLFITNDKDDFVPTPLDHNLANPRKEEAGKDEIVYYTPFNEYIDLENTSEGKLLYTNEYDAKMGVADSFMSLTDGHIESGLFTSDLRVGIGRSNNAFFKKEYQCLAGGYSFAVVADIDGESLDEENHTVMLGQGKVPFAVSFKECDYKNVEDFCQNVSDKITANGKGRERLYFFGNSFVNSSVLYEKTLFSVIETRDYRCFRINAKGKFEKDGTLYRMVKSGSILIPDKGFELDAKLFGGDNAENIGFNKLITIGDNKNEK